MSGLDLDPRSDEELVLALRDGDLQAFEGLYRRFGSRLKGYLLRAGAGDEARAEDLVHEVFMRVLKDRSFDPRRGRFAAWLFAVARNEARQGHRKAQGREAALARRSSPGVAPGAFEDGPVVHDMEGELDRRRKVSAALETLSQAHQQALLLKQVGGLTYAEMADALGVAEGTMKSRVHAAVRAFRSALEPAPEAQFAGLIPAKDKP